MFPKPSTVCPVCGITLGYLTKNELCSFICAECKWIFTWGRDGKLKPPVKYEEKKSQTCDCGGCQYRDEQKVLRNLKK